MEIINYGEGLSPSPIIFQRKVLTMTDSKKVCILEKLLKERDAQIRELQEQNAELQDIIDSYENVENDMRELKELVGDARELSTKQKKLNQEYEKQLNGYRREMRIFMAKNFR